MFDRKNPGRLYSRWNGGDMVIYPGDAGPGDEYFVDATNGSATNSGKSWEHALITIDAAVNLCTANNGDRIYVAPFHTETLAADSAIDIDVAGVSVVGVLQGRQMPTLSVTATAGDCKLAADNVMIQNIRFTGDIDATTGCIEVTGDDCAVIDCEYRDVTGQATDILITNNAMRLLVDGFRVIGALGDGGDSAIMLDECDHAVIRNCEIIGNFDVGAIECRTTACDDIRIHDVTIKTAGSEDLAIADTITGSTGIIGPNVFMQLADNAANITEAITGATFVVMDSGVHVVNLAGEKSLAINWTASTDGA